MSRIDANRDNPDPPQRLFGLFLGPPPYEIGIAMKIAPAGHFHPSILICLLKPMALPCDIFLFLIVCILHSVFECGT
jgi:hypothetical protein